MLQKTFMAKLPLDIKDAVSIQRVIFSYFNKSLWKMGKLQFLKPLAPWVKHFLQLLCCSYGDICM